MVKYMNTVGVMANWLVPFEKFSIFKLANCGTRLIFPWYVRYSKVYIFQAKYLTLVSCGI